MKVQKDFGIYVYKKEGENHLAFKDMLQFMKVISPQTRHSFSYVEAKHSLHPELSLWENLQLVLAGVSSWRELCQNVLPEYQHLLNLLTEPSKSCHDAEAWEKFIISFYQAILGPSQNILIEMNEEMITPFFMEGLKKVILSVGKTKKIILATANPPFWLDCAHTLVNRVQYHFNQEDLDEKIIESHWAI